MEEPSHIFSVCNGQPESIVYIIVCSPDKNTNFSSILSFYFLFHKSKVSRKDGWMNTEYQISIFGSKCTQDILNIQIVQLHFNKWLHKMSVCNVLFLKLPTTPWFQFSKYNYLESHHLHPILQKVRKWSKEARIIVIHKLYVLQNFLWQFVSTYICVGIYIMHVCCELLLENRIENVIGTIYFLQLLIVGSTAPSPG